MMKYGKVDCLRVNRYQGLNEVSVDFIVDSSVLCKFIECLVSADGNAKCDPIAAILEHSAKEVD